MISKESFVYYINRLKELKNIYSEINKIGRKFNSFEVNNYEYEDLVVKILEKTFKDEDIGWIEYYLYELDFGEEWCEGKVTDKNGNDIPLKTAENLYDILIKNYKEVI